MSMFPYVNQKHSEDDSEKNRENKTGLLGVPGRVSNFKMHPIKELYNSGVDVTINSVDILIFDSDVLKEYLRLYEAETLTAEDLDYIRVYKK